jgi:hypothetical protein
VSFHSQIEFSEIGKVVIGAAYGVATEFPKEGSSLRVLNQYRRNSWNNHGVDDEAVAALSAITVNPLDEFCRKIS